MARCTKQEERNPGSSLHTVCLNKVLADDIISLFPWNVHRQDSSPNEKQPSWAHKYVGEKLSQEYTESSTRVLRKGPNKQEEGIPLITELSPLPPP